MNEEDGCLRLLALDEKLLQGDSILSAWLILIVDESDTASADNAYMVSILAAAYGIETNLRSEFAQAGRERAVDLISQATIDDTSGIVFTRRRKQPCALAMHFGR
jgi:hypothetical protein